VAESCGVIGNGAIDPDETVTVDFVLRNAGSADTTNVMATLLATGGVTGPSGPFSYGALLAGGASATQSFTFAATGECGGTLTATLALEDNGLDLGVAVFEFRLGGTTDTVQGKTNSAAITLLDNASASPYPSSITVAGLAGTISKVTATLRGFSHTYPADVDVVLVSPDGQVVSLMGAVGGGTSVSGAVLTFDDEAASGIGEIILSGTYLPSGMAETMNAPAPAPPYGSALADFNGGDPNGVWRLYALDAADGDSGSIAQGWSISVTASEPLCCGSNKPPIFAALGNQSVIESNLLSFAVTATDPYDGDPITLTASNLPAGATFPVTNGNATFIWENPEPTGTYAVAFYAEDKDGTTEKAISITVQPTPYVDTNCVVLISEYVEGSSNNKALEIYNPTVDAIDLGAAGYYVMGYQNGSSTVGYSIALTGTIPAQDVFVLANSSATAAILGVADMTSASLGFSGDDAVVLRSGRNQRARWWTASARWAMIPARSGDGLTGTADNTLRRKATVKQGDRSPAMLLIRRPNGTAMPRIPSTGWAPTPAIVPAPVCRRRRS
jgi:subtilisin-like proprotein convertase family protein